MKKKLKMELKLLYDAPKPQRKEEFLWKTELPGISYASFLWQQIPYIRKWNWGLQFIAFMLALFLEKYIEAQAVWMMAAFVPFLALAVVAESGRSIQYNMEEMELAARFPLKAVVMSRFAFMGGSNMVLLILCILLVGREAAAGLIYSGGMILTPYLLSACLNLFIVRKVHGSESIYGCLGASVLISGITLGMQERYLSVQLSPTAISLALVIVSVLAARESIKFVKQTEEYVWS